MTTILLNVLISLADVLVVILPVLLSVAFMTIIERKQLAAHQRRVGPNSVGKGQNPSKYLCINNYFFIILNFKNFKHIILEIRKGVRTLF